MRDKFLFFGFTIFAAIMFSIVLFADESVEKIDIFDTAQISATEIESFRQTVAATERKTHCQIGQVLLDGKYIEANYQDAFYHFFLCGKPYSWPETGATFKQFIPVFKSGGIQLALETAKEEALAFADDNELSAYEKNSLKQSINKGYSRAVVAQKKVSSGKTYQSLLILLFILGLSSLLFSYSRFHRIFKRR